MGQDTNYSIQGHSLHSAMADPSLLQSAHDFMQQRHRTPSEIRVFHNLLTKMLTEKAVIDWDAWKPLPQQMQRKMEELELPTEAEIRPLLERLAVVRLNGGLGTTMGCSGPKSLIEVKDGLSFLEISLRQHEEFCRLHSVSIPLLLMNSFNTDEATRERVGERATPFVQSQCPRLDAETLLPVDEGGDSWYPPGHGNIVVAMHEAGLIQSLLAQGRDIVFVSNIDNTGAEISVEIAKLMADESLEYLMECTEKTAVDLKGGTLISIDNHAMHLEMPQVPREHIDDFCSTRVFSIFNTNNIWLNLKAVADRPYEITSEIITTASGRQILQLETSIGGAIRNFTRAFCVHVPRSRFIPVKGTPDLLAVSSSLYSLCDSFCLRLRHSPPPPPISLSSHFSTVAQLHRRFPVMPTMKNLKSLSIEGDISFEGEVTFEGEVRLSSSSPFRVPSSAHFNGNVALDQPQIMS